MLRRTRELLTHTSTVSRTIVESVRADLHRAASCSPSATCSMKNCSLPSAVSGTVKTRKEHIS